MAAGSTGSSASITESHAGQLLFEEALLLRISTLRQAIRHLEKAPLLLLLRGKAGFDELDEDAACAHPSRFGERSDAMSERWRQAHALADGLSGGSHGRSIHHDAPLCCSGVKFVAGSGAGAVLRETSASTWGTTASAPRAASFRSPAAILGAACSAAESPPPPATRLPPTGSTRERRAGRPSPRSATDRGLRVAPPAPWTPARRACR